MFEKTEEWGIIGNEKNWNIFFDYKIMEIFWKVKKTGTLQMIVVVVRVIPTFEFI